MRIRILPFGYRLQKLIQIESFYAKLHISKHCLPAFLNKTTLSCFKKNKAPAGHPVSQPITPLFTPMQCPIQDTKKYRLTKKLRDTKPFHKHSRFFSFVSGQIIDIFVCKIAHMKITLLVVGKTDENYLEKGISIFEKRVKRYLPFEIKVIPALKNTRNMDPATQKEKEGEQILRQLKPGDYLMLLDEKGKSCTSREFAHLLQKRMNQGIRHLYFVVGGPYGFAPGIYQKSDGQLSVSKMTFSHQMIRLLFTEQLYRAFAILNNEPYHND